MNVQLVWRSAQPRPHLCRPSAGCTDVLLAMFRAQPMNGYEIAEAAGRAQPNVCRWLHQLAAHGFAEVDFVIQGSAGRRPAQFWVLTRSGEVLAGALAVERAVVSS